MTAMTLDDTLRQCRATLAAGGLAPREISWVLRDMLLAWKGWRQADILLKGDTETGPWLADRLAEGCRRVAAGEPPQYVVGTARFHGLNFAVDPRVLIPRPETEMLVDLVADEAGERPDLRVLDICTGSGCIAIALARTLRFARVEATDISEDALEVARANAAALKAKVAFRREDILAAAEPIPASLDIVVSNPPYILPEEEGAMQARVAAHEPRGALFVPQHDPLLFVRAIARHARAALRSGGTLWLEINPLLATETAAAIADAGLVKGALLRDERGKLRFARAEKA